MERPAIDLPVRFQGSALGLGVCPDVRSFCLPMKEVGVEGNHGCQTRGGVLAWLDIGGQAETLGEPIDAVGIVPRKIDRASVLTLYSEHACVGTLRL